MKPILFLIFSLNLLVFQPPEHWEKAEKRFYKYNENKQLSVLAYTIGADDVPDKLLLVESDTKTGTNQLVLYYYEDWREDWQALYLRRWGMTQDGRRGPCHWTYAEQTLTKDADIKGFLSGWRWKEKVKRVVMDELACKQFGIDQRVLK